MMTASEAERIKPMAQKGRSVSLCVTAQVPPSIITETTSSNLNEEFASPEVLALMQAAQQASTTNIRKSPSRLKTSPSASPSRRSSSCRIQGTKPPRIPKRFDTDGDEEELLSFDEDIEISKEIINPYTPVGFDNLPNIYLKKVGSFGGLINLSIDEPQDGSPKLLRRSASARRHPTSKSSLDSPNSQRLSRSPRASSVKHRSSSRRGTIAATNTPRKGFLDVQQPPSAQVPFDPDAYLLRNFQTTHKGM